MAAIVIVQNRITAILPYSPQEDFQHLLQSLVQSPLIEKIMVITPVATVPQYPRCETLETASLTSGEALNAIIKKTTSQYLMFVTDPAGLSIPAGSIERLMDVAVSTGAGMVYSDYLEKRENAYTEHPLNDYQRGSIRDGFDFGFVMLFSRRAVNESIQKYGDIAMVPHAGLYDLRLKVSIDTSLFHIQEFLYSRKAAENEYTGKEERNSLFDYVNPRNDNLQKEMEGIATQHLKNIGAYLRPEFKKIPPCTQPFPVEASVIIPVRNRKNTIADAIKSAVSQETNFLFNVIVVDNHSADGTTTVVSKQAKRYSPVKVIIPQRLDLNIGGCWNEAVCSADCGRYVVQLDSDDLYNSPFTLQKMVDVFRTFDCAMVIGSYTLVDESLEEIPPGLINHREWTDSNGHNNALRVNGVGAPRAFDTALVRQLGFLNVGYGEDYALALRLSREYRIGRIYESLYLCRRWTGNTDAALPLERINHHDFFKDKIRTIEIMARQKMNKELYCEPRD